MNKYIVTVIRTKAGEVSMNAEDACSAGMKALDIPEEELSNLRKVSQYYSVAQEGVAKVEQDDYNREKEGK